MYIMRSKHKEKAAQAVVLVVEAGSTQMGPRTC